MIHSLSFLARGVNLLPRFFIFLFKVCILFCILYSF